jgi:biotin operon repressor
MITITKNEEVVLNQIKIFAIEYPDGVPLNVIRKDLGFHEYDLVQIVEELQDKGLVIFNDNKVTLSESEKEVNTVNSKKDLEELELNQKEKDSYKLIKELVDDRNLISKYTLEGHLLYGDLEISNFRMYHIILSLQNKGLLKPIDKDDGEYYLLVE